MASAPHQRSGDVAVSEELVAPVGSDVELCYQTFGSPDDDPLLLVMGLGGPMNWWDTELCRRLAQAGFFVIRYDNRDTGRSSRMPTRVRRHQLVGAFAGAPTRAPYSSATWPATRSPCSTTSGWTPPTSWACRWAG